MSLFRRREPPKAAVCCASPAMTRRAADWLRALGGCKPIAILSDDCEDVVWQCAAEQADLLLLETDFSEGVEDKDVSARCDIAIEVRRRLPECGSISSVRTATRKSRRRWKRRWSWG